GKGALDAGGRRDLLQIDAEARVASLVAGLAVVAVVDAHNRQIGRVQDGNGGKRADVHQELAIARDHQHPLVWAGEREPETDHGGTSHRARHGIGVGAILGERGDIARGAGKTGDNEKILVSTDESWDGLAPVEHETGCCGGAHVAASEVHWHRAFPWFLQNFLAPRSLWVKSTATARPAWNTIVSAAATVASTSSGLSERRQVTPMASSTGAHALPMGYCHGLPSPKSPRMLM